MSKNSYEQIFVKEALLFGRGFLRSRKIQSFEIDAEVLLTHVTGLPRVTLLTASSLTMSSRLYSKYAGLLRKRAKHMPIAYIINNCEFFSLPFYVDSSTLIPRPDTEVLVETVINEINYSAVTKKKQFKILEIGTGSGCISIAIAANCDNALLTACDISQQALDAALLNADKNNVKDKITFVLSDLFENISGTYDIIISNPPYIPTDDITGLDSCVRDYEPIGALDGGEDGLDFYRQITGEAKSYLESNGMIFYEIGYNQARDVKEIFIKNGFDEKRTFVKLDYSGRDRVVYARRS